MKISILHPSRSRASQAWHTQLNWLNNADNANNIEYILSLDYSDIELAHYTVNSPNEVKCIINRNTSAIEAINNAAKTATGDLLVVISDDFDCPEHWDTLLLNELQDESDFVLKTRDGIQKTLVTLPICDRVWYERYGYIYHPEYRHMGCDVELTAVAIMTSKLLYSDLLFSHNHYSTGKTPKDAINEKNDLTYSHGDEVLARHRVNNFGIINPSCSYESIQWH